MILVTPTFADELMSIRQLFNERKFTAAIELVDQYLSSHPSHHSALLLKALIYYESGQIDESIDIFKLLIKQFPGTPELYNNLATAYGAKADFQSASEMLQKAIHLRPNYRKAQKNLDEVKVLLAFEELVSNKTQYHILSKYQLMHHIQEAFHVSSKSDTSTASKIADAIQLTKQIQDLLTQLGFYSGDNDGMYNKNLVLAIKDYQKAHHLSIDGKVSKQLLTHVKNELDNQKASVKNKQMCHALSEAFDRVAAIQRNLFYIGYDPGALDGFLSQKTVTAIKRYQAYYNLPANGQATEALNDHIKSHLMEVLGKWTIVPVSSDEDCSQYIHLKAYVDYGFKPLKYVGTSILMKNNDNSIILLTNSPAVCRNMSKSVHAIMNRNNP